MPKIDPRDVLPQSNLPVPSVPWGRAMQSRLQGVEERLLIDKQDIDGQNRTTAAQLASISEQLKDISDAQATLVDQQSALADQQQTLSSVQAEIIANQQRIQEGSTTRFRDIVVNSNSSDFAAPNLVIPAPSWATSAMVTCSMSAGAGSTTRLALLVTSTGGFPGDQIANYGVTNNVVYVQEASQPAVVEVIGGSIVIYTYRNVMETGSGVLNVNQAIAVTWIA